jgi:hypothetical protein
LLSRFHDTIATLRRIVRLEAERLDGVARGARFQRLELRTNLSFVGRVELEDARVDRIRSVSIVHNSPGGPLPILEGVLRPEVVSNFMGHGEP